MYYYDIPCWTLFERTLILLLDTRDPSVHLNTCLNKVQYMYYIYFK